MDVRCVFGVIAFLLMILTAHIFVAVVGYQSTLPDAQVVQFSD